MARVTNKFYIQAIHDGSSIYAELVSTKQLVQTISDKGVVNPNWTTAANQPVLYPRTKLNGAYKGCSGTWYYNDNELTEVVESGVTYYTFNGDGHSTGGYFFKKENQTVGTITYPGLRIIRNLAGVNDNYDNDVIRFDGQTEEGGHGIDFSVARAIRITRFTGTGNYGLVLGGKAVTADVNTTVVFAQLYDSNTGAALAPSSYKTKWYRDGIDASNNPHWSTTAGNVSNYTNGSQPQAAVDAGVTLEENCQWITIGQSDIDDNVTLRCVFLNASDDSVLYTAWGSVDDETDGFQMQIRCDSADYIGADYIQLKSTQDADMKCWMGHNLEPTREYSGFTKFMCKLYDNHNTLITVGTNDQDSPLYGKTVDTSNPGTNPKYGFFDVTQQNMPVYSNTAHTSTIITATYGGKLSIKYDYIDRPNDDQTGKKGGDGGITGYFMALSEEDASNE